MHHKATISQGSFEARPIHFQCSCGTAGDFRTADEAMNWVQHVHFRRLSGIDTFELPSATPTPASDSATHPESEAGVEKETLGAA